MAAVDKYMLHKLKTLNLADCVEVRLQTPARPHAHMPTHQYHYNCHPALILRGEMDVT